jgi:hypothetical protein
MSRVLKIGGCSRRKWYDWLRCALLNSDLVRFFIKKKLVIPVPSNATGFNLLTIGVIGQMLYSGLETIKVNGTRLDANF